MADADEIITTLQNGDFEYHTALETYLRYAEHQNTTVFQNLSTACDNNMLDKYPDRGGSFCTFLWHFGPYAALLRAHPKNRRILNEMGYSKTDDDFEKGELLLKIFEAQSENND